MTQAVYEEGLRGSQWLAETLRRLPSRRGLRAVGLTDGPTDADTPDGLNQREHVKAASQVCFLLIAADCFWVLLDCFWLFQL